MPPDVTRGDGNGWLVRFSGPIFRVAVAYGLANWLLYTGDTTRATAALERILASPQWASFGYIAAEADLARLRETEPQ